jgi:hypothetical protein
MKLMIQYDSGIPDPDPRIPIPFQNTSDMRGSDNQVNIPMYKKRKCINTVNIVEDKKKDKNEKICFNCS